MGCRFFLVFLWKARYNPLIWYRLQVMGTLGERWQYLTLSEEEDSEIVIDVNKLKEGNDIGNMRLVGWVFTERSLNKEVSNTMKKIWRSEKSFFMQVLSPNIFLLRFETLLDQEKVLQGRPWLFDACLFNLQHYNGSITSAHMGFHKASFWVHMHNLPLSCTTEEIGEKIVSTIGREKTTTTHPISEDWKRRACKREPIPIGASNPITRKREGASLEREVAKSLVKQLKQAKAAEHPCQFPWFSFAGTVGGLRIPGQSCNSAVWSEKRHPSLFLLWRQSVRGKK